MKLHFIRSEVEKLIAHAEAAKEHRKPCVGQALPALFLVGDQGVYLMSSGIPSLARAEPKPDSPDVPVSFVAYAVEVNPDTMPFDDWWANKQASFGGDDGSEQIRLASIKPWVESAKAMGDARLELSISPTMLELVSYVRTPKPAAGKKGKSHA